MLHFLKNLKKSMLLSALCSLAAGIVMIVLPGAVEKFICILCGAILCLSGLFGIVSVFVRPKGAVAVTGMIPGILAVAVGLEFLFRGDRVFEILWFFIGLILLVDAVYKLQYAFEMKTCGVEKWWMILLVALASLILAIVLMIQPASEMIVLTGAFLAANGIFDLFTSCVLSAFADKMKRVAVTEVLDDDGDSHPVERN